MFKKKALLVPGKKILGLATSAKPEPLKFHKPYCPFISQMPKYRSSAEFPAYHSPIKVG